MRVSSDSVVVQVGPDLKLLQPLRVDGDCGLLDRDMQRLQIPQPCFSSLQRGKLK